MFSSVLDARVGHVTFSKIRHVLVERDILTATKTPWLVRLLYAFQDTQNVYLAMEYVPGGDFRTLLNNSGVLKEEHAKFYISEMFISVNELHKLGYVHRDLKPEVCLLKSVLHALTVEQNFLVDGTGHVKLTDFGLATGALNPKRVESLKIKVRRAADRLDVRSPHHSLTRSRTIKLCIDLPSKGDHFTVLFDAKIIALPILLLVLQITWLLKFCEESHTHTLWTIGPWVAFCSNF